MQGRSPRAPALGLRGARKMGGSFILIRGLYCESWELDLGEVASVLK